jgi:hypothetical protein
MRKPNTSLIGKIEPVFTCITPLNCLSDYPTLHRKFSNTG